MTHSDVWSLRTLPKSVVIVGAAATGCQLASIFAAFGAKVTLLEVAPRILQVEDICISDIILRSFEQHGIEVITGIEGVEKIEQAEGGFRLHFQLPDGTDTRLAGGILMSTGWIGNLSALNLPAAQVETVGPYVKVNDYYQTSAANIFAAGDITGRMMLVQSAGYEALAAAEHAVLGYCQPKPHKIVPHGGFTDPEYGSVGLTEANARAQQECVAVTVDYHELDRAIIDGHPEGLCKLIVSRQDHQILGAHVAGEQALEVVEIVAAGMAAGMPVEKLADLEIAYPTFTAIIGLAARRIMGELGRDPLMPQWHSLGPVPITEWERHDE